ncbi:MAG: zinc ribbon domain-containing protein [Planctomycetes bacterium]|nr:zinc ribbon domain-containing protein [Planctomycetota bacterium]
MPTYEYRCDACGHEFERVQRITARPVRTCPSCRRRKVRRLLGTGVALIFKGPGFYATDYRSSSYKEAAKKDAAPAPAPASKEASGAAACEACTKEPKSCPRKKGN